MRDSFVANMFITIFKENCSAVTAVKNIATQTQSYQTYFQTCMMLRNAPVGRNEIKSTPHCLALYNRIFLYFSIKRCVIADIVISYK